jgi:glycosyltransferase involved in cell wall biosynthesis
MAMRVSVVDPPAFTPPYDHALCAALARAGARVELVTSRFAYGEVPAAEGYTVRELFYARAHGAVGSRRRRAAKLVSHVPDMLRYRALAARTADVVHFQWLGLPWVDDRLMPDCPVVFTAHDLLPREPRPGQLAAQRRLLRRVDAVVVHSQYGRGQLVDRMGLAPERVHVIHHGAFVPGDGPPTDLPPELDDDGRPVVLLFGLLRPYKGVETLLRAWAGIEGGQLWIVGRPMIELPPMPATASVVARFVSTEEADALLRRADLVVLPYTRTERFDQSGVLATALGAGRPAVLSDIGGFSEVAATGAARLVAPGDADALHDVLAALIADPAERERMSAAALAAARGPYSWDAAAQATLRLYAAVIGSRAPAAARPA